MDMAITLACVALGAGLTALFGWAGARPFDPVRGVRLVPWRFLMMLGATFTLVALVHLVNLMGVTTGR